MDRYLLSSRVLAEIVELVLMSTPTVNLYKVKGCRPPTTNTPSLERTVMGFSDTVGLTYMKEQ